MGAPSPPLHAETYIVDSQSWEPWGSVVSYMGPTQGLELQHTHPRVYKTLW